MLITNKNIRLNYKQLRSLPTQLGYQATKVNGSHITFKHENPKSVILLKQTSADEEAHPAVVASAIANVIYSNVADAKEIELLAQGVTQYNS